MFFSANFFLQKIIVLPHVKQSLMMLMCVCLSCGSVMANSLGPQGLWPTRLLCPWNFPGKNNAVGCHFLLQGISPTQRSNPYLLLGRKILYLRVIWDICENGLLCYYYCCFYIYHTKGLNELWSFTRSKYGKLFTCSLYEQVFFS